MLSYGTRSPVGSKFLTSHLLLSSLFPEIGELTPRRLLISSSREIASRSDDRNRTNDITNATP